MENIIFISTLKIEKRLLKIYIKSIKSLTNWIITCKNNKDAYNYKNSYKNELFYIFLQIILFILKFKNVKKQSITIQNSSLRRLWSRKN